MIVLMPGKIPESSVFAEDFNARAGPDDADDLKGPVRRVIGSRTRGLARDHSGGPRTLLVHFRIFLLGCPNTLSLDMIRIQTATARRIQKWYCTYLFYTTDAFHKKIF